MKRIAFGLLALLLCSADALRAATERIRPGEARRSPAGGAIARPALARSVALPSAVEAAVCSPRTDLVLHDSNVSEESSQLEESVASLASGGFAAVWNEGAWPNRGVHMQWFDSAGAPSFPAGGKLLSSPGADAAMEVIAPNPAGGAFAAFVRGNDVLVQSFDAAGVGQWPGDGAAATDGSHGWAIGEPFVLADGAGGAFACFDTNDVGPALDVRCQRFSARGTRLWAPGGVSVGNGGTAEWRFLPRAVSDGAGGLLVFWENLGNQLTLAGNVLMEGQRFTPTGAKPWGTLPKVVRTTGLAATNGAGYRGFQVASDGSGGAVLAFNDATGLADANMDVVAQRVTRDGDLLWGAGAIVTAAAGHQQHEMTIGGGDGSAYVVVFDEKSSTASSLLIYRLGADGVHLWGTDGVLLSRPDSTALNYDVYGSFDGGVLRLAHAAQLAPASYEIDARYVVLAPDARPLGEAWLTQAPDAQYLNGLAFASSEVFAIWDDLTKGWNDSDEKGALLADLSPCSSRFHTLSPCRLVDTRASGGSLSGGEVRLFATAGACGIPGGATAIVANVTAVDPSAAGFLTVMPAGQVPPLASSVSFRAGQTRAALAVPRLAFGDAFSVLAGVAGNVDVVVDVTGYFQ